MWVRKYYGWNESNFREVYGGHYQDWLDNREDKDDEVDDSNCTTKRVVNCLKITTLSRTTMNIETCLINWVNNFWSKQKKNTTMQSTNICLVKCNPINLFDQ